MTFLRRETSRFTGAMSVHNSNDHTEIGKLSTSWNLCEPGNTDDAGAETDAGADLDFLKDVDGPVTTAAAATVAADDCWRFFLLLVTWRRKYIRSTWSHGLNLIASSARNGRHFEITFCHSHWIVCWSIAMGNKHSTKDNFSSYEKCPTDTPSKNAAVLDPRSPDGQRTPVPATSGTGDMKQHTPLRKAVFLDPRSPTSNRTPVPSDSASVKNSKLLTPSAKFLMQDPRSPGNPRTPIPAASDKENKIVLHAHSKAGFVDPRSPANDRTPVISKKTCIENNVEQPADQHSSDASRSTPLTTQNWLVRLIA